MIKQNIKVALFSIISLITFWLVLFSFVKIDVASTALISFSDGSTYMSINTKTSAYIENHDFEYVKLEYEKQYFDCHITFIKSTESSSEYFIVLPEIVMLTESYFISNIIIDSLNIYQYIFKK